MVAITASISSGLTSTSRAFEPSLGPTTPRLSRMSISRPALAKPTRSLRCSIEVEPNCVETTSSIGLDHQVEVVADVVVELALAGRRGR